MCRKVKVLFGDEWSVYKALRKRLEESKGCIRISPLLYPPTLQGPGYRFCPRCERQYAVGVETCRSCYTGPLP